MVNLVLELKKYYVKMGHLFYRVTNVPFSFMGVTQNFGDGTIRKVEYLVRWVSDQGAPQYNLYILI